MSTFVIKINYEDNDQSYTKVFPPNIKFTDPLTLVPG
jgi:hypothetical protein